MPNKRPDWKDELNRVAARLKSGGATASSASERAHGPNGAPDDYRARHFHLGTSASVTSGDPAATNEGALPAERHEAERPCTADLGGQKTVDIDTASHPVPASVVEIEHLSEQLRATQEELDSLKELTRQSRLDRNSLEEDRKKLNVDLSELAALEAELTERERQLDERDAACDAPSHSSSLAAMESALPDDIPCGSTGLSGESDYTGTRPPRDPAPCADGGESQGKFGGAAGSAEDVESGTAEAWFVELLDELLEVDARLTKTSLRATGLNVKVKSLKKERDEALKQRVSIALSAKRLDTKLAKANQLLQFQPELSIRHTDTLQWMLSRASAITSGLPIDVHIEGEGPWSSQEFQRTLKQIGFSVAKAMRRPRSSVLIVGREGWNETALETHIEALDGQPVRIFPQELFVASLLAGSDPFSVPGLAKILELFGYGHPAIDWLRQQHFPWPEVDCWAGPTPAERLAWQTQRVQQTPLVMLGYHAGITVALTDAQRQQTLNRAFRGDLPWTESDAYMQGWGRTRQPCSPASNGMALGDVGESGQGSPEHDLRSP